MNNTPAPINLRIQYNRPENLRWFREHLPEIRVRSTIGNPGAKRLLDLAARVNEQESMRAAICFMAAIAEFRFSLVN